LAAPTKAFLVSATGPVGSFLNVSLPRGPGQPPVDTNPALNFTGTIDTENVAWTTPRPSYLATGSTGTQGVAFFNLDLLKPNISAKNQFTMTLVEGPTGGSDVGAQFSVRASLWNDTSHIKQNISNGAFKTSPLGIKGCLDVQGLTGRFSGPFPQIFVTATDKHVTVTRPTGTTGPSTATIDVSLSLAVIGSGGTSVPGSFIFFIASDTTQSNTFTAHDVANRVSGFSQTFTLTNLPAGASISLVMQVIGPNAGGAAMTIDPNSTLTITTKQTGHPPATKTYTLDNTVFPFGSLFGFANPPVSYPGSSVNFLLVGVSPQSNSTFQLGYKQSHWRATWP
jgi:hypothetical protein